MNKLLASTAVCLVLGTAAFAQSPNSSARDTSSQPQSSSRDRDKDTATQRAPDPAAQNRPSGSDQSSQNQSSQNQSSQNQSSQNQSSQSQPSQNQSSGSAKDQPASSAQNQPPPPSNTNQSAAPAASSGPSQAQTTPPAQSGSSSPPSQAQTGSPPATNNQAQQSPGNANTNTAQQPAPSSQSNTAQSHPGNVNASVHLNDQQRSRVSQSFARLNVQPLRNVNFQLSVGTVVPRDVHLRTVPADIVEIVPQYRGYSFFAVRDEIVIVDPATYKIVTVLPRSGSAAAPASSQKKVTFTDRDRDVVRKHVRASTERRTTGSSAARVEIRRGERVPDTVEIEEFPETVYREVPSLRDYRYIHRDSRIYVVEPTERRIIEEID